MTERRGAIGSRGGGATATSEQTMRLPESPDAAPLARRFVARALRGTAGEALTADAEVVVSELVTNAVMYAEAPVTVRVQVAGDRVRVEVDDSSREAPVRALLQTDTMTGRGLALVEALTSRWGVRRRRGGKVVWAELGGAGDDTASRAVTSAPARWPDPDEGAPPGARYTVHLGDVPTDLLLAAKAHVDSLMREFMLARGGAATGHSAPVTPDLARLIQTVTTRFAEARQAIKQQALAAAAAGEPRTTLTLTLPVSSAAAGRDYLAALDEADDYARAARLLTLETPPQHRAFRQWYVAALVDQLQALARGEEPPKPPTFEQHLLGELGAVAIAHRAADRAARLQEVTASLAVATDLEGVAKAVVTHGVAALGASGGGLLVPVAEDEMAVPGTVGYGEALVEQLRGERRDAPLPAAVALRTGEAIWLESREQRDARFPALTGLEPATVSMCAVPLKVSGRVLGALRFSFSAARLFDEQERAFVLALAAQTAQAVDRAELHLAERTARSNAETAARRLMRLQHVTVSLAGASTAADIGEIVATEAAETLGATLSALCVLEDETTMRVLSLHGARPGAREQWETFPLDADLPASVCVRTNRPVIVPTRAELEARFPLLVGQVPVERSLVCVPVSAGGRQLGALSLSFPPERVLDSGEVELLVTIGRQCGLALERARLFAAERAARERARYLADATGRLTASLEPEETLRQLMDLVVPHLADWAAVYLADASGQVKTAMTRHRDPRLTAVMDRLQREQPLDVEARGGLGEVMRTGRSIRYARVPDEIRSRTTQRLSDPSLAASLAPRSGLGVALVVRGRVLGALALARTEGPAYTEEDLVLVEEVAARAAVAVDNAQQFGRERDAALTLQRSLLPQQLPRIEGVSFAWRYLPGAAGTHIGGDWYDVIALDAGRVALVIGDVMGRGLRAAAVMGQLRATARAHASADLGPAEVLARLDAAVARLEQDQITTALFGLLHPADRSLTIASAGHLPPLVTTRTGPARYLGVEPGPPLGSGAARYPELRVTLPPASTLLLFTDGLVEDRQLPVDRGLELLRAAAGAVQGPEALCDRALAALGRDTEHDDDTAMLAVGLGTR